jgi:hypothetical protein
LGRQRGRSQLLKAL